MSKIEAIVEQYFAETRPYPGADVRWPQTVAPQAKPVQPPPQQAYQREQDVAKSLANAIVDEARPEIQKMAEELRNQIFMIRPSLGQMVTQGWDKFKNFWHNWVGGVKESLEGYKILSEYMEKLLEIQQKEPRGPLGGPNYNVARQRTDPEGYRGPFVPNPYSVHDAIKNFVSQLERKIFVVAEKHILHYLHTRPAQGGDVFKKDKLEADLARSRLKADELEARNSKLNAKILSMKQELQDKDSKFEAYKKKYGIKRGRPKGSTKIKPSGEVKAPEGPAPEVKPDPEPKAEPVAPAPLGDVPHDDDLGFLDSLG